MLDRMIKLLLLTFVLMSAIDEGQSVELTIEPTELDVSVFTGKEKVVNITCTASSPVVVIMWSINGTTVTSDVADITNTVVDNKMLSTLTLKRPTPRMSGRYICHIPFLISDTSCTVRIRAPIFFLPFPKKVEASVGDNVTLVVVPFGLGLQTVSWARSRRNTDIKPGAIGVHSSMLLIPNIDINDAGRYTCIVTSSWSQNQTKLDLVVKYPSPIIVTQPQNYTTFLSLPASFHCNATSSYPITYSWRRVSSNNGISSEATGQDSGTLMLPSLSRSDEGWYQCVADVFGQETVSQPVYLAVKDLPAPQNVVVMMDVKQNRVMLNWTKPDDQILSDKINLMYRLYYSMSGGCEVTTCKKSECKIERRRFNPRKSITSESFGRTLSPYTNYTWRLELTYTRGGSDVATTETVVSVLTSQSAASAPTNLTVLETSFQWINLTWSKPQCPNGVISHYRVYYNDSYEDAPANAGYYVLRGLSTNTFYNISVVAITGEDIVGEHYSVTVMTTVGAPLIQSLDTDDVVVVNDDVTSGVVDVTVPPVSDQQGHISFIYILVSQDGKLKPSKSRASHSYKEATDRGLVYYVAAVLNYTTYNASNTFALGNGETTTGLHGQEFQNHKLSVEKEYYYFIRAYSAQYTTENELVSSSALYEIGALQEPTTEAMEKDDSSDFPIAIVAGVAAGLILVIAVLVAIIVCCCYVLYKDSKYLPPERIGSRRYLIRNCQRVAKKKEASNGNDSPDATVSVDGATPNVYNDLLESIKDNDNKESGHYYSTVNDNVTKPSNDGSDVKKVASNSPCSVTSPEVSATINPALGITEEKGNRNSDVAIQLDDLPSQEVPQLVSVPRESPTEETPNSVNQSTLIEQSLEAASNEQQSSPIPIEQSSEVQPTATASDQQSTPKKQSKHSLFKFHGWRKSKRPSVDHTNPLFEKLEQTPTDNKDNEETPVTLESTYNEAAVDVIPEKTKNNELVVDVNQEPST